MHVLQVPVVVALLWTVAALAAVWILVPVFGHALRLADLKMEVTEDPREAEPRPGDPAYEEKFRQLSALGFLPVGKTIESTWFLTPLKWRWRSHGSRVLASSDGTIFVELYRLRGMEPLRTCANTILVGGGMVQTAAPGVGTLINRGHDRRIEIGNQPPATVIASHEAHVRAFCDETRATVRRVTFREAAHEILAFDKRALAKMRFGPIYFLVGVFVVPALLMLFAPWPGLPSGLRAAGVCAAALFHATVRWLVLPSRVPQNIRLAPLFVGAFLLTFYLLRSSRHHVDHTKLDRDASFALDRMAVAGSGGTAREVDLIVSYGPAACRPLLDRLEDPTIDGKLRDRLRGILVALRGSDLGAKPEAWEIWCATVRGAGN